MLIKAGTLFIIFAPWEFCSKRSLEASRAVSWSLPCYRELKLHIEPFISRHSAAVISR